MIVSVQMLWVEVVYSDFKYLMIDPACLKTLQMTLDSIKPSKETKRV